MISFSLTLRSQREFIKPQCIRSNLWLVQKAMFLLNSEFWNLGPLKTRKCTLQDLLLSQAFAIPRKLNFALCLRELSCISLSHNTNTGMESKGHVLESRRQRK